MAKKRKRLEKKLVSGMKRVVKVNAWGVFHATESRSLVPIWVHHIRPFFTKSFCVRPITITYSIKATRRAKETP